MPLVYAAKFLCGDLEPGLPNNPPEPDGPVRPGRYSTAINIHNPHRHGVVFRKKAVLLYDGSWKEEDRKAHEVARKPGDFVHPPALEGDWGMEIDCADIREVLLKGIAGPAPAFIKGWVVIEVEDERSPLDVVAVYTSEGLRGQGLTLEIERVPFTATTGQ